MSKVLCSSTLAKSWHSKSGKWHRRRLRIFTTMHQGKFWLQWCFPFPFLHLTMDIKGWNFYIIYSSCIFIWIYFEFKHKIPRSVMPLTMLMCTWNRDKFRNMRFTKKSIGWARLPNNNFLTVGGRININWVCTHSPKILEERVEK